MARLPLPTRDEKIALAVTAADLNHIPGTKGDRGHTNIREAFSPFAAFVLSALRLISARDAFPRGLIADGPAVSTVLKRRTWLRRLAAYVFHALETRVAVRIGQAIHAEARGSTDARIAILFGRALLLRYAAALQAELIVWTMRVIIAIHAATSAFIAPLTRALIGPQTGDRRRRVLHLYGGVDRHISGFGSL